MKFQQSTGIFVFCGRAQLMIRRGCRGYGLCAVLSCHISVGYLPIISVDYFPLSGELPPFVDETIQMKMVRTLMCHHLNFQPIPPNSGRHNNSGTAFGTRNGDIPMISCCHHFHMECLIKNGGTGTCPHSSENPDSANGGKVICTPFAM